MDPEGVGLKVDAAGEAVPYGRYDNEPCCIGRFLLPVPPVLEAGGGLFDAKGGIGHIHNMAVLSNLLDILHVTPYEEPADSYRAACVQVHMQRTVVVIIGVHEGA